MDTTTRYLNNHDTVLEIGERLGFKLHSFDPDWMVYYTSGGKLHEIPDEIMEILAKSLNLPWENVYKSPLNALLLHKAKMEKHQEETGYNIAWTICEAYIINELHMRQSTERIIYEIVEK